VIEMKAVIVSAHPDDAETAAGGLIATATKAGHEVVILHGGPAVKGLEYEGRLSWDVRIEEATAAAAILGARVEFFDWGHSEFEFNRNNLSQLSDFLDAEAPDLVVAHWPIDTHPDHQVIGALTQAVYIYKKTWTLAFFEVFTGIQALDFVPNRYLDISAVIDQKNHAIRCHISQSPESQVKVHERISRFRGQEIGVEHAEAFHLLNRSTSLTAEAFFH